jgi:hypothetical protein
VRHGLYCRGNGGEILKGRARDRMGNQGRVLALPLARARPQFTLLDAVPNRAREGLYLTPNHPPPANRIKKKPLVNCWFTEGSRSGKRLKRQVLCLMS